MLNKKHILTCILAAGMLFALSACSSKTVSHNSVPATTSKSLGYQTTTTKSSNFKAPDFPDDIEHEPPQGEGFDITNEDIFEKGYYAFQFDSFSDAYIFWGMKNNSDVDIEWSVYRVDNELSEDEIKELAKTEPLAINEGSDSISEGQWIYVLCNINKETASAPVDSTFYLSSYRGYA